MHRSVLDVTPDEVVVSPRNPRVLEVLRLHKRRERDRRGLVVAEGLWALRTALEGGVVVDHVYFCRSFFRGAEPALLARAQAAGARLTELSERALIRLSSRDGPDGIVGVMRKPRSRLPGACPGLTPLVCVAQSIEKPGNLGAIMRTACAANADLLVVCDPLTDAFSPPVVRASLGALFLIPIALAPSARAIDWLRAQGIAIYAATPQGADDPWSVDLAGPAAIVIGNEHRGLGEVWLDRADGRVRIPMVGPMNSLNASTAAGVMLFEAVRQRRQRPGA